MKEKIVLKGRCVVEGCAEGEAIVTKHKISGYGAVDPKTGSFVDEREPDIYGRSFAGKILVFDGAKGASGWSLCYHDCRINGVAPLAMLFNVTTTKVALGAVVARTPAVTDFENDISITDIIQDGDWVRVDATNGVVEITKSDANN